MEKKISITYSEISKIKNIIPLVGDVVKVYGQEAVIDEVHDYMDGIFICYLNQSIIVPDKTYCRNYILSNEIEKTITHLATYK